MPKKTAAKPAENGHEPPPVLDLDLLIEPDGYFQLGGKKYDYPSIDAMSLLQQKTNARDYQRMIVLSAQSDVTEDESAEYEQLVRALITRLSSMPKGEAAKAPLSKLETACTGYFIWRGRAVGLVTSALNNLEALARSRIGATSSPDSPSDTEGALSNG